MQKQRSIVARLFKHVTIPAQQHYYKRAIFATPRAIKFYSTVATTSDEENRIKTDQHAASKQYFELYQQGDSLCKAKKFKEAIPVLTEAIRISDANHLPTFDSHVLRSFAYEQEQQYFLAAEDISTVLNRNKHFDNAQTHSFMLCLRARIQVQMRQYLAAIVDYTKALSVDTQNANELRMLRAEACFYNDDFNDAIKDYTICIKNNHKLESALMGRAMANVCLKQFQKAADDAGKVFDMVQDPNVKASVQNVRMFCLGAVEKREWQNADMRQFKQLAVSMLFQNRTN